jgi:transposase
MRRKIPAIRESVELLEARYVAETDERRKQRLYMLYLLQSRCAKTMQDVAPLLEVHRVTVGRWLYVYEKAGLEGLLAIPTSPGRPLSLPEHVLEQLKEYLQIPGYFRSYKEIHLWICAKFHCNISYKAVHKIVRYVLKAQITRVSKPRTDEEHDMASWEQAGSELAALSVG